MISYHFSESFPTIFGKFPDKFIVATQKGLTNQWFVLYENIRSEYFAVFMNFTIRLTRGLYFREIRSRSRDFKSYDVSVVLVISQEAVARKWAFDERN